MRLPFEENGARPLDRIFARGDGRRRADVAGGGPPRHPPVSGNPPADRADYHLTPHETRLLKLLVEGHNNKTAALEVRTSITIGTR